MSFKAKLVGNIGNGIYIQNNKENKNRIKIEGLSKEEWNEFSYTVTIDDTGYLGFFIYNYKQRQEIKGQHMKNMNIN